MAHFIGIDIAKASFTVHIKDHHKPKKATKLDNSPEGFHALHEMIDFGEERVVIAMEATGIYFCELAHWAFEQGLDVFVINPAKIRHHAKSMPGIGNKTDLLDAWLIADYAFKNLEVLKKWAPRPGFWSQARALSRRREELVAMKVQASNRKGSTSHRDPVVLESHQRTLDFINKELETLEEEFRAVLKNSEGLTRQIEHLKQIPGVGEQTARLMSVELGDLGEYEQGKDLTACVGLGVQKEESGTSVRKGNRIARNGNARAI